MRHLLWRFWLWVERAILAQVQAFLAASYVLEVVFTTEEVLVKAARDAEFAREEVTRLVSEQSRVEESLLSTQSAPSCSHSLSSSFHHVLSDMQSSPGVDETIVAQGEG